jgi:phosphate uptake regulator
MVSLPAKWTRKYSIEKGDLLDVEEIERSLKITSDKPAESVPVEFDTKDLSLVHIKKYLHEMYQFGYDEIKLLFEDGKLIPEIQAYISSVMIGYEVVDQQAHSLTVKSISQSIEGEFDPILRRAFLVTKQLGANSLALIREKEYKKLKDILVLEDTNDKLTNFCLRVLNKKGYKSYNKTSFIYCLIWQLEKLADEYRYLCQHLIDDGDIKVSKEVIDQYEKVNNLFNQFYELFYSYSKKDLTKFASECTRMLGETMNIQSGTKGRQDVLIGHLYVMVSYMYTMMGPLIGLQV